MNLGIRIKEEREKLNMSQDELAEKMNITRQAISKWETGKSFPDIEKILELSNLFNLSLDELVKGDKAFQENLIKEGTAGISGLEILGYITITLGILTVMFGGSEYSNNWLDSNFLSYVVGGLVLVTGGLAFLHNISYRLLLASLFITAAAVIVYMIGFRMELYALLSGVAVIAGLSWWLATLVIKFKKTDSGK